MSGSLWRVELLYCKAPYDCIGSSALPAHSTLRWKITNVLCYKRLNLYLYFEKRIEWNTKINLCLCLCNGDVSHGGCHSNAPLPSKYMFKSIRYVYTSTYTSKYTWLVSRARYVRQPDVFILMNKPKAATVHFNDGIKAHWTLFHTYCCSLTISQTSKFALNA